MIKVLINIGGIEYRLSTDRDELCKIKLQENKAGRFIISLCLDNVIPFHYNAPIQIVTLDVTPPKVVFTGFILRSKVWKGKLYLSGSDYADIMAKIKLNMDFKRMNPLDMVYHIVKGTDNKSFYIEGNTFDNNWAKFDIYIPIINLVVEETTLEYNGVTVSRSLPKLVIVDITSSQYRDYFLKENISFAKYTTMAKDFIDAYKKALDKTIELLDWLSFTKNYSLSTNGDNVVTWNYDKQIVIPVISSWYYGIMNDTGPAFLMLSEFAFVPSKYKITDNDVDDIALFKNQFGELNNNDDFINILHALHWFRRSKEFGNIKDHLLDCFTCLEFLVNKQITPKLFDKRLKASIKERVSDLLNEDQANRFSDYINHINAPSFKTRLLTFLDANDISLTDSEKSNLESLRKKRNELEHGVNDITLDKDELNILHNTIEAILINSVLKANIAS